LTKHTSKQHEETPHLILDMNSDGCLTELTTKPWDMWQHVLTDGGSLHGSSQRLCFLPLNLLLALTRFYQQSHTHTQIHSLHASFSPG